MMKTVASRHPRIVFISAVALVIIVGLILGAFIVRGFQPARLAGVNHLNQFGYACKSVFQEATYYQSECIHEYADLGLYEESGYYDRQSETQPTEETDYDHLLGVYPWIWEAEEPATHLGHAASRLNIVDYEEGLLEFDFATGVLAVSEQVYWLVGEGGTDEHETEEAAWVYFPATADAVCADADASDYKSAQRGSVWSLELSGQAKERAVVTINPDDQSFAGGYDFYYCVELLYTEDGGANIQRSWIKIKLPAEEMVQQVKERDYVNEAISIVGMEKAAEVAAAHFSFEARLARFGAGPGDADEDEDNPPNEGDEEEECDDQLAASGPICEEDIGDIYFDGVYVDMSRVTVELPDGWADFSQQQREEANPYGCWRRSSIDEESGRCLYEGYELIGYEGTPDWLTIELPDDWVALDAVEKSWANPYGCSQTTVIDTNDGRCLSDRWNIWGYAYSGQEQDEGDNYDIASDLPDSGPLFRDIKLRVKTFEDAADKAAYFVADPVNHPCQSVIDGVGNYVISGSLYVIYADEDTPGASDEWDVLFEWLILEDSEAVLYDLFGCQERVGALEQLALSCQQSGSTEGVCGESGLDDERWAAVVTTGRTCQTVYDNIDDNGKPAAGDMADCLLLTDRTRSDFINSIKIVSSADGDDYSLAISGGGGVYNYEYPYVAWKGETEFSYHGHNTRFQFEKVALHEYLHKFYFRNLDVKDRMRLHQEMLALYEDRQKMVFGYLGESDLRGEIQSRAGRHGSADMSELDNVIQDINDIAPQIREALPADIREEYGEFLDDRHGVVAFIYALGEPYLDELVQEYGLADEAFASTLELDFIDELERIVAEANNNRPSGEDPIFSLGVRAKLGWTPLDALGRLVDASEDESESDAPEEEEKDTEDDDSAGSSWDISTIEYMLYSMQGFFTEGYPILALETSHTLSPWLDEHYSQYFDRASLTSYFEYHPPLLFEPAPEPPPVSEPASPASDDDSTDP